MSENLKNEGWAEPAREDLATAEANEHQAEVQFRVVRLDPEDPDKIRKRNGLHAGGMVLGGIKRAGQGKLSRKGWSSFS